MNILEASFYLAALIGYPALAMYVFKCVRSLYHWSRLVWRRVKYVRTSDAIIKY